MNISGTAAPAALVGYQTGEMPLEVRTELLKTALENQEAQAGQLIEVIEAAGSMDSHGGGLDTYA